MVARLQFIGARHADAHFRATLWSQGPRRRRWWLVLSLSVLTTSTLILGRRCGRKDRVADEATMMACLQLIGAHHADAICRTALWSQGPRRRRWWLVFSLSALVTLTLILGRRCGRKDRVADEATIVARFQHIGAHHADTHLRATLWSQGPRRRRWWLVSSLSALVTPTLILGRRCGRKDRVADEATMMARLQHIGADHADVICRETLWSQGPRRRRGHDGGSSSVYRCSPRRRSF
jgi:hypothetical protein